MTDIDMQSCAKKTHSFKTHLNKIRNFLDIQKVSGLPTTHELI